MQPMPRPFEEVLRRIERVEASVRSIIQLGTVTAVDGTDLSLTVEIAGQAVTGVRWAKSYTPTVGDFVIVERAGEAWIVNDELSRDLTGPGFVTGDVVIEPSIRYAGEQLIVPTVGAWSWFYSDGEMYQGRNNRSAGNNFLGAGIAVYPSISSALPFGATVTACKIRFKRSAFLWNDGSTSNMAPLVSPIIYGHTRTTSTVPTTQAPASLWTPGFGPWRPGSLARGEAGQWDLPSTWLTALLAGTITGIGTWSDAIADHTWWQSSATLQVSYTAPA